MDRYHQPDSDLRLWERVGATSLAYSDGDAIESRLLAVLKNALDVSSSSPEISAAIQDWPSEYHFSPVRHNLLRPFTFKPSHHILELGCGCGSITRYLGETGATVVSVEGSQRRAAIAAERCRDLPNVSIYRDNIAEFQSLDKFDFVTLIGVLEYAPKFIGTDDPIGTCLRHAKSFLKDDGVLILAIENQLGLKYFNGCNEDHLGIPYYGVNDLYGKNEPVTFGRHVLTERLKEAGFQFPEFHFPFPDYKLPGLILSEAGLCDDRLNVADLLIHNTGRSYPETHHRAFAEDMTWRVVTENRLLADLSNSFLIVAGQDSAPRQADWLAKMYSRGRRNPCYQVASSIERCADQTLIVRKQHLFHQDTNNKNTSQNSSWLQQVVTDSHYLAGTLCLEKIHRAMARESGIDELARCFAPWLNFLLTRSMTDDAGQRWLPGDHVDCIPANVITSTAGDLSYFDAEWVSATQIPFGWVVIRGIVYSLSDCLENTALQSMTYRQFITQIAQRNKIFLNDADFAVADRDESRLIEQCQADQASTPRLADFIDTPLFLTVCLANRSPDSRHSLAWHQAELARIKKTVSWRITAPLRVFWNIGLRLAGKYPQAHG